MAFTISLHSTHTARCRSWAPSTSTSSRNSRKGTHVTIKAMASSSSKVNSKVNAAAAEQQQRLQRPDANGRYGRFGGKYVPETLISALLDLEKAYAEAMVDEAFRAELDGVLRDYVGRASPLYHAENLSEYYKRADGTRPEIYLKREDLNHTGAHKINNSLGQALLCKRMGKKRIIAETGAGQHGVATATVCAR